VTGYEHAGSSIGIYALYMINNQVSMPAWRSSTGNQSDLHPHSIPSQKRLFPARHHRTRHAYDNGRPWCTGALTQVGMYAYAGGSIIRPFVCGGRKLRRVNVNTDTNTPTGRCQSQEKNRPLAGVIPGVCYCKQHATPIVSKKRDVLTRTSWHESKARGLAFH
jgi:hypothetical protein